MSSICFFTLRNPPTNLPKQSSAGHPSHAHCCSCHMGLFPGGKYIWGVGLAQEGSPPKNMFYSSSVPLGVACFGFCLMFLLKTNMCVCVLLLFWCFCLHFCLPLFLSLPLSPSPLSLFLHSVWMSLCMCLCGCFIPGEMKSLGPYVMQQ